MKHGLVTLVCLALACVAAAQRPPANTTIAKSIAKARENKESGNHRQAAEDLRRNCGPDSSRLSCISEEFSRAPRWQQEELLFEYLQACKLAAQDGAQKTYELYSTEMAYVAATYVRWYAANEAGLQPGPRESEHLQEAFVLLGEGYAVKLDWPSILREYLWIVDNLPRQLLPERSLLRWFKALRLEGANEERCIAEVRTLIAQKPNREKDWRSFRDMAIKLSLRQRLSVDLDDALDFAREALKQ